MNILNYTPSPKMKELLYSYLQIFEDTRVSSVDCLQDLLTEKVPLPILYLSSSLLYRNGLIKYNADYKHVKPTLPKSKWKKAIENIELSDAILHNFESDLLGTPYITPKNKKITFKELTEEEYLKKSEFYDYEFATLFNSNGLYDSWWLNTDYLYRSFNILHDEKIKDKKRLHIFVAESEGSVLGYISISNYVKGVDMFFNHNLPCNDEELFYVNYIQTRQESQRRHIGSVLLGLALNEVFNKDNAYAVAYEPICDESELMFDKISKPMNLEVYKRNFESREEYKKYGSLKSHIITKKEEKKNYFDFLDNKENY